MHPSVPPGAAAAEKLDDAYQQLLSRTRDLHVEQRLARDRWFRELELEGKDELLFELEVLLKAAGCFSNPRNHPGPPRRAPVVTQDFRESAQVFRDGAIHAIGLARALLGQRDRAFVFHRYLETVLPEDGARSRLAREGTDQTTPEQSLLALRYGLTSAVEVMEGLLRGQRVPYRTFYASLSLIQREVERNAFFNPLSALEFRPEFDRIRSPQVLDLLRTVPVGEAHRLVALTFLSLFRMLRYLRLIDRIAAEGGRRRRLVGRAFLALSVLRSDARALSGFLRQRGGPLLAASYERDLLALPAREILGRAASLRAAGHRFVAIKSALEGVAGSLRLELRRAFLHDLPAPGAATPEADLRTALRVTTANLRPALRKSILFLGATLGTSLDEERVFDDTSARREMSSRLRQDVWMFAQIVRAFAAKARHSTAEDRWDTVNSLEYVREFLAYFRTMGYPLLRATEYPRFDAFLAAMGALEDTDLVDPARLSRAVDECSTFYDYLQSLFDEVSKRDVLQGVPFNRREAAMALRLYVSG